MKKLIVALLASTAAITAAQAQTISQPRYYLGAGVTIADHEYSLNGVTDEGDAKAAGKIFGGAEFNQTWGVEAGYTDLRASDFSYNGGTGTSKGFGSYLAAKANVPINDQFSAFAKLGVSYNERKLRAANVSLSDHDTGAYGALGVQYAVSPQMALTAEYERYGKDKEFGAKADAFTLGARYSF